MEAQSELQWLNQGAELRICPLCVAARDHERAYLRELRQGLSRPGQEIADFVRAPGLCLDHLARLEQSALDGDGVPGQDVVNLYLGTLEAIAGQLSELEQDGWLQTSDCPMCVYRDREIIATAQTFMAAVAEVPSAVSETLQAGGLCVGHFVLTWVNSGDSANRDLLRDIQLRATRDRMQRLRELCRESDSAEARHRLGDAWKRAARSVSGWTATRH